ncbi:MAG: class I SAM-dependent methyltransferase [Oligoflexales bacterium]
MQPWQSDLDHMKWLEYMGVHSFDGHRVLDLGCGSGFLCEKAMESGALLATGVDIVEPEMQKKNQSWEYLSLNLDGRQWRDHLVSHDKYSLILAFDIIEHLKSPYDFLEACLELLAEDGKLVVTTPNLMSWERYANPHDWSGVKDPQHKILFNRYSLTVLLNRVGYAGVTVKAPLRSLSFLGALQPHIGGQMLCVATP